MTSREKGKPASQQRAGRGEALLQLGKSNIIGRELAPLKKKKKERGPITEGDSFCQQMEVSSVLQGNWAGVVPGIKSTPKKSGPGSSTPRRGDMRSSVQKTPQDLEKGGAIPFVKGQKGTTPHTSKQTHGGRRGLAGH